MGRPAANAALSLLLLLAIAVSNGGAQSPTPSDSLIVQKDLDVAKAASNAVDVQCKGGFKGSLDRKGGRSSLKGVVGGDNFILNILKASKNQADILDQLKARLSPAWVMGRVAPVLTAILLFSTWWVCCWTCCPFCVCCRCCRRTVPERSSPWEKGIFTALLVGLAIGIFVCAVAVSGGYKKSVNGFENMACTSAKLLNATLSGQSDPVFLGMMPLLQVFDGLAALLLADSTFIKSISELIDSTQEVDRATAVAGQTLAILRDALNANAAPKLSTGGSTLHVCNMCVQMAPVVDTVSTALTQGVATALVNARGQVKSQLSGPQLTTLHSALTSALEPIKQVKDTMRDTFATMVQPDQFLRIKDMLDTKVLWVILLIVLLAVLVLSCGCTGMGVLWLCEASSSVEVGVAHGDGTEQYSKTPHRCSACAWCCAYYYATLVFIVGGLLMVIAVPLSGFCLVMDDLSGSMIRDIAPAMELNISGDQGDMMINMIDECFRPKDENSNAQLLEIIKTRDNESAPLVSLKDKLVTQTLNMINKQFDGITNSMANNSNSMNMSSNADVQTLARVFRNNPIDATIVADKDYGWSSDAKYKDIFTQEGESANLPAAVASSAACLNTTLGTDLGGMSIMGAVEVLDRVRTLQIAPFPMTSVCGTAAGVLCGTPACKAGQRFFELKSQLRTEVAMFKCIYFQDPTNPNVVCDVKNMVTSGKDCVQSDGITLTKKEVDCDLAKFTQYIQDYETRILNVIGNLDNSVHRVFDKINVGLRALVNESLMMPVEFMADRVTCGFLGQYYQQTIDGLCFQGVWGLNDLAAGYVACASLTLCFIVLMYAFWRRTIDNVNASLSPEAEDSAYNAGSVASGYKE